MKKIILTEIFNTLKSKPQIFKKIKVVALVGTLIFLMIGALTVYLGVMGVRYVACVTREVNAVAYAEELRVKVEKLPLLSAGDCFRTAQGMLNFDKLLGTSMRENMEQLKQACYKPATRVPAKSKESEFI